jgi:hypothetical protein
MHFVDQEIHNFFTASAWARPRPVIPEITSAAEAALRSLDATFR